MIQISYLLLLVASSYGQQNTTQDGNSSLDSVLVDLTPSAKQEDVANETLREIITTALNTEPENVTQPTVTSSEAVTEPQRCMNWSGEEGICVPYFLCNSSNLYDDGHIDINGAEPECDSYIDVCCPAEKTVQISTTVGPELISKQVNKSCGYGIPDGFGFIIGNNEPTLSNFGEYPWMVAVLRVESVVDKEPQEQKINIFLGGGSLIHPSVVLTAAHVVHKDSELRVRAGEWDTQSTKEIYPHQDRDVKEVVLHPEFNKKNLHNDIALLFLSDPVDISPPHIGVACLPNLDVENTVSKTQCLASGWGKDRFGKEGRYSVILKKVELSLVSHGTCEKRLRGTRLGTRFQLDSSFMCAGGEAGKDTCVGDGGAPLVCPVKDDKDRYVQNGIVAWGIGCGKQGVPGVYVNVANYRRWIDENIISHGYNTDTYTF